MCKITVIHTICGNITINCYIHYVYYDFTKYELNPTSSSQENRLWKKFKTKYFCAFCSQDPEKTLLKFSAKSDQISVTYKIINHNELNPTNSRIIQKINCYIHYVYHHLTKYGLNPTSSSRENWLWKLSRNNFFSRNFVLCILFPGSRRTSFENLRQIRPVAVEIHSFKHATLWNCNTA